MVFDSVRVKCSWLMGYIYIQQVGTYVALYPGNNVHWMNQALKEDER